MSKIDTDRLLLGTDFTKYTTEEEMKRHLSYFDYWSSKMNIRRNINKLIKNPAYAQLWKHYMKAHEEVQKLVNIN